MGKNILNVGCCFAATVIASCLMECNRKDEIRDDEKQSLSVYAKEGNPEERLQTTIDLLTNGTIKQDMPLSKIQIIFGDDLIRLKKLSNSRDLWTVRFESIPEINKPDYATDFTGWYLRLEFDNHNRLVNYYLSNIHK